MWRWLSIGNPTHLHLVWEQKYVNTLAEVKNPKWPLYKNYVHSSPELEPSKAQTS